MAESKKTILITGASGHIGQGFTEHYLERGFKVIGVANRGTLPVAENFTGLNFDLEEIGAGFRILDEVSGDFPKIDYIINNAARQDVSLLANETGEKICEIFQVNVSVVGEIYAALSQKDLNVESILNITSIEAVTSRAGHSIYGASKAALEALTKSAAHEIAPIRSNALRLGLIEREGIEEAWPEGVQSWRAHAPLVRMGTLKDVLRAAEFLLEANWLTGSVLTLDGGISAVSNW